jgi:hypothetical protein
LSENLESLRSQRTKLQHAMEKLIDSFTEGLIEKDQFTTRMARVGKRELATKREIIRTLVQRIDIDTEVVRLSSA